MNLARAKTNSFFTCLKEKAKEKARLAREKEKALAKDPKARAAAERKALKLENQKLQQELEMHKKRLAELNVNDEGVYVVIKNDFSDDTEA